MAFSNLMRLARTLSAALVAAALVASTPASASTPLLAWAGATRLQILCNLAVEPGVQVRATAQDLCTRVAAMARRNSPMPVAIVPLGDPAVLSPDAVTLLVHASVRADKGRHLLAFTMRPFRNSSEQTAVLFGSPPRATVLDGPRLDQPDVIRMLQAAVREVVPWHGPASGRR